MRAHTIHVRIRLGAVKRHLAALVFGREVLEEVEDAEVLQEDGRGSVRTVAAEDTDDVGVLGSIRGEEGLVRVMSKDGCGDRVRVGFGGKRGTYSAVMASRLPKRKLGFSSLDWLWRRWWCSAMSSRVRVRPSLLK